MSNTVLQSVLLGALALMTACVTAQAQPMHERDVRDYVKVRSRFLGDARPASMPLTGAGLVRSGFLLEIEAVAAKV